MSNSEQGNEPPGAGPGESTEPLQTSGLFRSGWLPRVALACLLTTLLVAFLVRFSGGVAELRPYIQQCDPLWLGIAVVSMTANILLVSVRLCYLLGRLGYRVPLQAAIAAVLSAWPLGLILPSRAGDLARAHFLRGHAEVWRTVGAVSFDKVLDLQSALLVAAAALLLLGYGLQGIPLLASWMVGWVIFVALCRSALAPLQTALRRRRLQKLDALLATTTLVGQRPRVLSVLLPLSLTSMLNVMWMVYALAQAFNVSLEGLIVCAYWPLAMIVGMLPVTVGGVGTRDAAFILLLSEYGGVPDTGGVLVVSLAYSLVTLLLPSLAGLVVFLRTRGMLRQEIGDK